MIDALHPLETTTLIRDTYLRYLQTIYPFQSIALRNQFQLALSAQDFLLKGPLLEAAPPSKPGLTLQALVKAGILHEGFRQLDSEALPFSSRPLHLHQQQAIEKSVAGRNVVVSTGTGSGKTETFLIPILDHLLREAESGTLSQPGVRALLLYPMNALANDQMKRLRRILEFAPDIKFGRYTGETENRFADAKKLFHDQFGPGEKLLDNELIAREQIQAEPPHILVTNYAMLEYLLLRPRDTALFDEATGQHWRFIVLDEAHVYDGAAGIEIAMLLRRLKDRVVQSQPGRLRIIATSATLGKGQDDFPKVVQFASELFGEVFEWKADDAKRQDVVKASPQTAETYGPVWGEAPPALYHALNAALADPAKAIEALAQAAKAQGIPPKVVEAAQRAATGERAINQMLYALLQGDARLRQLQLALTHQPSFLPQLAETLFPGEAEGEAHLVALVNLAARARPQSETHALLPARYHVFVRALEGAFVCLNEAAHGDQPKLFLRREERCPDCQSWVFEVGVCPRCGELYLVGEYGPRDTATPDALFLRHMTVPLPLDDARKAPAYFLWGEQVKPVDEDEAVVEENDLDAAEKEKTEPHTLCLGCGAVEPGHDVPTQCDCPVSVPRRRIYWADRGDKPELRRCVSCGARNNFGIVYRFLTGQDAPVSVLATALYQKLPQAREAEARQWPGEGRKLLSFADSRQDAAFFAPYLERTYEQILRRRLIFKALTEDSSGRAGQLRLNDVLQRLQEQAEQIGLFPQKASYDAKQRQMATWLMQEFIALDRRISLEGLGLLSFRLVRPRRWQPPTPLLQAPWSLTPDEAWALISLLVDTLRLKGAVTFPNGVDPQDEAFAPRNQAIYMREDSADSKLHILSWLPSRGSNRRLVLLMRVLTKTAPNLSEDECKTQARAMLSDLWRHLTTDPSWRDHFRLETPQKIGKTVYRACYEFWEFLPTPTATIPVYRCAKCHNLAYQSLRGICPEYGCDGELRPVDPNAFAGESNHYWYLYQNLRPIPLEAAEHTAQWAATEASKVQSRFVRGELNALSCSTTFELGVDVGDLQAVLMRNVPPTTANYLQRAGRAGRRTDAAAFALTYAQRRSHDLTYFADPARMVAGKINPPVISLTNEKIVRRHVHSVLFAAFFRWARDTQQREFSKVGDFFAPDNGLPSGPDLLRQYVALRLASLVTALGRIIPNTPALRDELQIEQWAWLEQLWNAEQRGLFDRVVAEVNNELKTLGELEKEASDKREHTTARHFQQVANTIRRRDLLGFLGSRNVLPKYGFPTDVVELRTDHLETPHEAQQVELQRDLRVAISEYAPGGEVVAAKYVWTSGGINKPPRNGAWDGGYYVICSNCGRFHSDRTSGHDVCMSCQQDLRRGRALRGEFIRPEYGFLVSRDSHPKLSGESRPQRIYASRVHFSEYLSSDRKRPIAQPEPEQELRLSSSLAGVYKIYSRYGWLALVNAGLRGQGFRVCDACGFAEENRDMPGQKNKSKKPHKNPHNGRDCNATPQYRHLVHEFMTDVLELHFDGALASDAREELWYSVLYALIEGASEALGIRRDDLDGTLYRYSAVSSAPALVLFDNVPGGAGHVARIAQALPETFAAALARMKRGCCGEETSCYECLRNFRNQPHHEKLKRSWARDFLSRLFEATQS